jgi:hypothetical protein
LKPPRSSRNHYFFALLSRRLSCRGTKIKPGMRNPG